jgi:hypothetical protein
VKDWDLQTEHPEIGERAAVQVKVEVGQSELTDYEKRNIDDGRFTRLFFIVGKPCSRLNSHKATTVWTSTDLSKLVEQRGEFFDRPPFKLLAEGYDGRDRARAGPHPAPELPAGPPDRPPPPEGPPGGGAGAARMSRNRPARQPPDPPTHQPAPHPLAGISLMNGARVTSQEKTGRYSGRPATDVRQKGLFELGRLARHRDVP